MTSARSSIRQRLVRIVWVAAVTLGCSAALPRQGVADPPAAAKATRYQATPGSQHDFADVEQWRRVFDDPRRDAWQKPAS